MFNEFTYADLPMWVLESHNERLALYWCAKRWLIFRFFLLCAVEKTALRGVLARVASWVWLHWLAAG